MNQQTPSQTDPTQQEDLLSPKTGTATSSPVDNTASPSDMNIVNTMLWMKKNAFEESTVKKIAKILRHLQRNCNTTNPEEVKLYIANKKCSNGRKQNLVDAYDKHIQSENGRAPSRILKRLKPAKSLLLQGKRKQVDGS